MGENKCHPVRWQSPVAIGVRSGDSGSSRWVSAHDILSIGRHEWSGCRIVGSWGGGRRVLLNRTECDMSLKI